MSLTSVLVGTTYKHCGMNPVTCLPTRRMSLQVGINPSSLQIKKCLPWLSVKINASLYTIKSFTLLYIWTRYLPNTFMAWCLTFVILQIWTVFNPLSCHEFESSSGYKQVKIHIHHCIKFHMIWWQCILKICG